jgi:hypothetical protein
MLEFLPISRGGDGVPGYSQGHTRVRLQGSMPSVFQPWPGMVLAMVSEAAVRVSSQVLPLDHLVANAEK